MNLNFLFVESLFVVESNINHAANLDCNHTLNKYSDKIQLHAFSVCLIKSGNPMKKREFLR